ncbi:MAG: PD-(D/E)XK nuclease family transposase [Bacteroidales bacterium]|nr:PD-(D/E)XK nuclease family transposase [Bacteroidales bacterium]
MTDAIRFVFLEPGRFKKRISELDTAFDKWIYLLKNRHRMTEIPPELSEECYRQNG